jgi:hypothetical protein
VAPTRLRQLRRRSVQGEPASRRLHCDGEECGIFGAQRRNPAMQSSSGLSVMRRLTNVSDAGSLARLLP